MTTTRKEVARLDAAFKVFLLGLPAKIQPRDSAERARMELAFIKGARQGAESAIRLMQDP